VKREPRGHERHHALSEEHPDLVKDPADGEQYLEQGGYLA
jgi:hypothetical protein